MRKVIYGFLIILFFLSLSLYCYQRLSLQSQPTVVKIQTESWQGSGVFVTDDLILTAGHLLEDVNDIWVVWPGGKKHRAVSWYKESETDLGIIYIRTLEIEGIAKFDNVKVGETVRAIGASYGYFPYITQGIISAVDVNNSFFGNKKLLMTDCPLNAGNSGCPLMSLKSEIVGICVGGICNADGMNFCCPAKICQLVINKYQIIEALKGAE